MRRLGEAIRTVLVVVAGLLWYWLDRAKGET